MGFLIEVGIVTIAIASSYVLLDFGDTIFVFAGIMTGYVAYVAVRMQKKERHLPKVPVLLMLLVVGIQALGPIIFVGLVTSVLLLWMSFAYEFAALPRSVEMPLVTISLLCTLLPALLLILVRCLPRFLATSDPDVRTVAGFLRVVGQHNGFTPLVPSWVGGAAFTAAIFSFFVVDATAGPLREFMTIVGAGISPSALDLARGFPILPVGLVTFAMLLVTSRRIDAGELSAEVLLARYDASSCGPDTSPRRYSVKSGVVVFCGLCVAILVLIYPIHLGVVLSRSLVVGLEPLTQTAQSVGRWVEEQSTGGRTADKLAKMMTAYGHWSPGEPEGGLPEIIPELRAVLSGGGGSGLNDCALSLEAGVDGPNLGRQVSLSTMPNEPQNLTYCIRMACSSPVRWESHPVIMLYSSHASQNRHWAWHYFVDVFAAGEATEPGGYCTRNGELADRFQG